LEKRATQPRKDDPDHLEIQPALVEKGRALFASAECAACHTLRAEGKPIASRLTAPALDRLKGERGCLAAAPAQRVPWYALSSGQRTALTTVIRNPAPPEKGPAVIAQTLTTFNCYACHRRDGVGGPDEVLNKLFKTTQPEMGDEARVPPPLDRVGAKLTLDYLRTVLDHGAHDRPYMHTRMPGFGLANLNGLAETLAAADRAYDAPAVHFTVSDARVRAAGRFLVGSQALGCIKCHTFAGHRAEGVQGIDMTMLPRRLRRDWFHAYLRDPQSIRPGTRMPAAWPEGKSFFPDLLDGQTDAQIEAIWVYLKTGAAQLPVGLNRESIPLVPTKSAILYRNFIDGAGTRAIAVGYPEQIHLAFDANDLRLALLWQGAFLDAARHWTDRGAGFEGPLGDNVLSLHSGAAFALLAKPDAAWPTASTREQGWKFLGYRLTPDDRPTFLYGRTGLKVEDFPNPVAGKEPALRRTLTLTATEPPGDLYFRAAVADRIEALDNGWYRIDGWKMKVESGAAPVICKVGGKTELRIPIRFKGKKARIVQEFMW
jgi:mono/diheme cytochrome c family protein